MSSKLLTGVLLGSAATAAAWAMLPEEKKEEIRAQASDKLIDLADYVTDYALTALDIVDERMAEMEAPAVTDNLRAASDNLKAATETLKAKKDQVVDRFTTEDFDNQTESIREQLAKVHQDREETKGEDIVIDATVDED
ncbi:MAG: hypothetical protein Q3959_03845 [Limosilactobacillus sp.]|uniref:hypothetical protein n=1 Tax=Limosilactobacillus sp. TaxID=2773925 RepID=UPI0026F571EB|nr:hypothetical protein [Limosilactobacillus sp.]